DLGGPWSLISCFGPIQNQYFALFRHLRAQYRGDWDRGVDRREEQFRAELREAFPEPRFKVPASGLTLRRDDGSVITDIDAIVADMKTGTIGLFQLKWHDIYGRSPAERESRRRNLQVADAWVEKVNRWREGKGACDIAKLLGLRVHAQGGKVLVFVLSRYAAHFTGLERVDADATWLSWPELLLALESAGSDSDVLRDLAQGIRAQREDAGLAGEHQQTFEFNGLRVNLLLC
ncbi:MAG TPA: hypothetical protein VK753_09605, partial [Xanthomonadaceae bacterium]|nr:hypothetical protein [Xanthomonadaceae bacterium]